jgi:hypothetical protein
MREAQILDALRQASAAIAALVEKLYPEIPPALRPAAAQQVKAHLDHLVAQGAITRGAEGYSLK